MAMSHFTYVLVSRWTFGSFPRLATVNNGAVNTRVHILYEHTFSVLWVCR